MVILLLALRDARGTEDIFGFLSDAVEERADLLPFFGGTESACDAKVLKAASPSGPVVGVPEVEGLVGPKLKGCHSTFTAATM